MDFKILVLGHSWAREFFNHRNEVKCLRDVKVDYIHKDGARLSEMITMVPSIVKPYHTHIILFSIMTDAYQKDIDAPFNINLLIPNDKFSAKKYSGQLAAFTEEIYKVNPYIFVIVVTPPALDLVYYNELYVPFYKEQLKKYYGIAGDVEAVLHRKARVVFDEIEQLRRPKIRWPRKITVGLSKSVLLIKPMKARYHLFLRQKIHTLGANCVLYDGVHPTLEFIQVIWEKLFKCASLKYPSQLIPVERPVPRIDKLDFAGNPPAFSTDGLHASLDNRRVGMQQEGEFARDPEETFSHNTNNQGNRGQDEQGREISSLDHQEKQGIEDPPTGKDSLFQSSTSSYELTASIEAMIASFRSQCNADPLPPLTIRFIERYVEHTVAFLHGYADAAGGKTLEKDIRKTMLQYLNSLNI